MLASPGFLGREVGGALAAVLEAFEAAAGAAVEERGGAGSGSRDQYGMV
jgi:hypothetical protein